MKAIINMSAECSANGLGSHSLRERNIPQRTPSVEVAQETVQRLNAEEYHSDKDEKNRRTFGRTPDGVGKQSSRCYGSSEALLQDDIDQ